MSECMKVKQTLYTMQFDVKGASEWGGPWKDRGDAFSVLLFIFYRFSKIGKLFQPILERYSEQSKLLPRYVGAFLSLRGIESRETVKHF